MAVEVELGVLAGGHLEVGMALADGVTAAEVAQGVDLVQVEEEEEAVTRVSRGQEEDSEGAGHDYKVRRSGQFAVHGSTRSTF